MRVSRTILPLGLALATFAGACAESAQSRRYNRKKAQAALSKLESQGLVIGEFALANNPVVDGDTIKVDGLDSTLRLLAIDTEETFKNENDRRGAEQDFRAYFAAKRGEKTRPVKAATPLGEEAKKWAKDFFAGVSHVRLERDHPKEVRGRFNRYLAYVFVHKNGTWVNYNVESVRAGMSPYVTKYSYSRRFHDEFIAAEKEAREAKLGIWNAEKEGYGDYDERKEWWDARADFIKDFERDAAKREDLIVLTHWDALKRIEEHLGKEVTILALVSDIKIGQGAPTRVLLSRRLLNDFPVVFFDKDVFLGSEIGKYKGEFVRVTGVVNIYKNKYTQRSQLQIVVNLPSQVVGSKVPAGVMKPSGDSGSGSAQNKPVSKL